MKNIPFIIFACFFLLSTSLTAQINDSGGHSKMLLTTKKNDILNEVTGSHFLDENFKKGQVTMKGYEPLDVLLRYDVNTETFEIKMEETGNDIYVLPLNMEATYYLGSDLYTYKTINYEGKEITGYFLHHFAGESISFLEKPYLIVTDPVKAKTGYEKDKPAQIRLKKDYYIVLKDASVKNVSLKEKDFERALSSTPAVKKYLSDHKLRSVEDFSKFVEWFDKQ